MIRSLIVVSVLAFAPAIAPAQSPSATVIIVRDAEAVPDAYASALAARVFSTHAGRTVLIVGHSNTVPALVQAFSGAAEGELTHDDVMFVVTADGPGRARVVRARYGR